MKALVTLDEINARLKNIFEARFEINPEKWDADTMEKSFLGREIGLAPRDLLYLFFDIEKEFGITIPQEDVVEGRFNTFNNVSQIVASLLK